MPDTMGKDIIKIIYRNYKKIFLIFFILYSIYLVSSFSSLEKDFPFFNTNCMNKPIIQNDYMGHFTQSLESSLFFKSDYRIWGYNPYYFAGYPSGMHSAIDNHWAFLFNFASASWHFIVI